MTASQPGRLRFALFSSFAPAGPVGLQFAGRGNRDFDYMDLSHWTRLARALEAARFDAVFWADQAGVHDTYKKSWRTAVQEAVQFPSGDPMLLAAALAGATDDLAFAFSANVIQAHPFDFARKLSTMDQLTRGRVAWNIVTSFQRSAWTNLGHPEVAAHSARYERAEEYVQLLYKLLEGSWEDGAVVRDIERRRFADADRVHDIAHDGQYYSVHGIHNCEPTPQRVPVLFQAGTSASGMDFASRNAECVFIASANVHASRAAVDTVTERVVAAGRKPTDVLFFEQLSFIVGSTEAEARRKEAEIDEWLSSENMLAFVSSTMGVDLSEMDLDKPIGDFDTNAIKGQFTFLAKAAPDKSWTFRDVVRMYNNGGRMVGSPEQIADQIAAWRDTSGITGVNATMLGGYDEAFVFCEEVVPVLQERGIMQREYAPGTMREKLFAGTPSASGPRVPDRHPAAAQRPEPVAAS